MYSSDDEEAEYPEPLVGIDSPAWMAQAIAFLAPKNLLYRGISGVIEHLYTQPETSAIEVLDQFVQHTVNGFWVDPYPGPSEEGEEVAPPITEIDIEGFREWMDRMGVDDEGPDAG